MAKVTFNTDRLGTLEHPNAYRFEPEVVNSGDVGEYVGPHPDGELANKDWHLVKVNIDGRELYVPCHSSNYDFETVVA